MAFDAKAFAGMKPTNASPGTIWKGEIGHGRGTWKVVRDPDKTRVTFQNVEGEGFAGIPLSAFPGKVASGAIKKVK